MVFKTSIVILATAQVILYVTGEPNIQLHKRRQKVLNNRPIIGVIMQSTKGMPFESLGEFYIAASYVKYLESSGARVVPIRTDLTKDEAVQLFYSINGLLLPGGDNDLETSGYARVGRIFLNLALKANEKGDYFPVWGTCLGHEFLSFFVSGHRDILSRTNSVNITLTLHFSRDFRRSKMFRNVRTDLAQFLSKVPSTANGHRWSVTVKSFSLDKKMQDFFNVISTSVDRNGTEFVSTMESKKYPIYSTQWHPEKNAFEWSSTRNYSHVAKAIEATQSLSNFFVDEARYNQHKFESEKKEQAALIYNFAPSYTGIVSFFEQCYIFSSSIAVIN